MADNPSLSMNGSPSNGKQNNPFSTAHGGIISTLLDTTMTAFVLSTLQKGFSCSTIEIKVNFIRPVTANTGLVRCKARPIHVGKRLATVEG